MLDQHRTRETRLCLLESILMIRHEKCNKLVSKSEQNNAVNPSTSMGKFVLVDYGLEQFCLFFVHHQKRVENFSFTQKTNKHFNKMDTSVSVIFEDVMRTLLSLPR